MNTFVLLASACAFAYAYPYVAILTMRTGDDISINMSVPYYKKLTLVLIKVLEINAT